LCSKCADGTNLARRKARKLATVQQCIRGALLLHHYHTFGVKLLHGYIITGTKKKQLFIAVAASAVAGEH